MLQAAAKPAGLDPDHRIGDRVEICIPIEGVKSNGVGLDLVGMPGESFPYDELEKRVLSSQWQGEFCRCSIDVVGGKQCDGGVDHLERSRHHTGRKRANQ